MELVLLLVWLVLCVVVASAAGSRGRNGLGWFLVSFFLSPLLGILLLLVLPSRASVIVRDAGGEPITPQTHVRCPDCRELVRHDAVKCRHCGSALVPQPAPPVEESWPASWTVIFIIGGLLALAMIVK